MPKIPSLIATAARGQLVVHRSRDFGVRVISFAVSPKNAEHVFAGAASGLWKKKDVKQPWRYVDTALPSMRIYVHRHR
jgi:hypothetical protein